MKSKYGDNFYHDVIPFMNLQERQEIAPLILTYIMFEETEKQSVGKSNN